MGSHFTREEAINKLTHMQEFLEPEVSEHDWEQYEVINMAKAALNEHKLGKWTKLQDGEWEHKHCGYICYTVLDDEHPDWTYCPKCGARMCDENGELLVDVERNDEGEDDSEKKLVSAISDLYIFHGDDSQDDYTFGYNSAIRDVLSIIDPCNYRYQKDNMDK